MLEYVRGKGRNPMFAAGLLRLARGAPSSEKWTAYLEALKDSSPLVRASAATALADCPLPAARDALAMATGDEYRLVRVEAAASLAGRPLDGLPADVRASVDRAFAEHLANLRSRPDDPSRHYNLGNLLQTLGDLDAAAASYETAARLDARFAPALVNLSVLESRRGNPAKAEAALRRVLGTTPDHAEANFNLGLLLAELGRRDEAEACLRRALAKDPKLAQAAYNLAVLVAEENPREAIDLCGKAASIHPDEPRYGYTLAFYQRGAGDAAGAADTLRGVIARHPSHADSIALLGAIHEESGRIAEAIDVYRAAAEREDLPPGARAQFAARTAALEGR